MAGFSGKGTLQYPIIRGIPLNDVERLLGLDDMRDEGQQSYDFLDAGLWQDP